MFHIIPAITKNSALEQPLKHLLCVASQSSLHENIMIVVFYKEIHAQNMRYVKVLDSVRSATHPGF